MSSEAAQREKLRLILEGAGLHPNPDQYDSNIHSWRCERPKVYGPCSCFAELLDELAAHTEQVRAEALEALYEYGTQEIDARAGVLIVRHRDRFAAEKYVNECRYFNVPRIVVRRIRQGEWERVPDDGPLSQAQNEGDR